MAELRQFVRQAWPIVVPSEPFQGNWHIDAICDHLEGLARLDIRDLLITIPPRFGKSTVTSIMFPAWLWIQGDEFDINPATGDFDRKAPLGPDSWSSTGGQLGATIRMLYSSYAQTLSTRDSLKTRQLIDSPWYQRYWGYKFRISSDQNEKMRFENDKKGYRLATSIGGAATGEGGDLIVCDDPHNVQESESELVRTGAVRWWNEVMSTRGNNPNTRRRLLIMQRSHEQDLAGDVLSKSEDYVHLNLPMKYESKLVVPMRYGKDPRTEDNQLLWPVRYDEAYIAKLERDLGSYGAAAQLQQRPAPLEGGMFKRSWWKFYKTDPRLMLEEANDKCWSWDCAFKDLDTSDFVCGLLWMRKGANFYLLYRVKDKLSFSATKSAVRTTSSAWPTVGYKLVEDKANGPAIIDDLKAVVGGLVPVNPEGGKEARASVVQPYAEAGNIWLPDPSIAPWVEDFIEEFRVFPNGAHDDQVDATSQAVVWLLKRFNTQSEAQVTSFTKKFSREPGERPIHDPRGA